VFFDAYFDLPGSEMTKRQPIELAPVVSVDEIGRITVVAATGEQRIQSAGSGMVNRVVSVTETLKDVMVGGNPTGNKKFVAQFNWVETLGCPSGSCQAGQTIGERVTGPMTLFGGSLYFATSSPAVSTGAECATGTNRVWGVDYKLNDDLSNGVPEGNADPLSGAVGALPIPIGQTKPPKTTGPSTGMVFGVAIEQRPSCSVEAETFDEDPYLGSYGNHTATTSITPGQFFLVYQVGGGSGGNETAVSTDKFELKPPRNSVWVDSRAPVFE
jgi:type IV pilus assembly protein PilY1